MTTKGSIIWKIGRKIEDFTYRNADKIIVISEDFKRNIMEKGVPENKIEIIPNWINTDEVYPIERKNNILFDRYNFDRNRFYVCYSGNLGHSQNLELLVEVAEEINLTMPEVMFVLIGEGAAKNDLELLMKKKNLENIVILPFQPYEDIAHVFSLGDVGLIISKQGIGGSSVPSKTWGIMAAGRPILASFDVNSELAHVISATNSGIVAEAGNKEQFIEALRKIIVSAKVMGNNGRDYVLGNLTQDICTAKWIKIVKDLV